MAQPTASSTGIATVEPSAQAPDVTQNLRPTGETFGAGVGEATRQFGSTAVQAAGFFNDAAADNAANAYQEEVNKILHGDSTKQVIGPDGQPGPDLGYLGLKGRAAMEARPGVEKALEEIRNKTGGQLHAMSSDKRFQSDTRRFKAIALNSVGQHADTQSLNWYSEVNKNKIKVADDTIANNPDNPAMLLEQREALRQAYVREAQLKGMTDPLSLDVARRKADGHAILAQASAVGVTDPLRAKRLVEQGREMLGADYEKAMAHFRVRADQQEGREWSDTHIGAQMPLENGADTKAVLRHFEGFRPTAYRDNGGAYRAGFGSDTVTRADGKVETVTKDTVVTREDAERDLERRATASQNAIRSKIGEEAWGKLNPNAKASLTSIAYNYGSGNIPQTVVDAAKSGDPQAMSRAILGLSGHNEGINRRRRAQEAANVTGELPPPMDQVQILSDIENSNLSPQAKSAAIAQATHLISAQKQAKIATKTVFDTNVANSVAEANQNGGSSNPVPPEEFARHYGAAEGAVRYEAYNADLQFAANKHSFENLSDEDIQRSIERDLPQPGDPAFARKAKLAERLSKYATDLEKQRRDDPAGVVQRMKIVREAEALAAANPNNPEMQAAAIQASLNAQESLKIPPEGRSAIPDAKAKQYAAMLKPVAKEGVPAQNQEQVINSVVDQVVAKYGDHAQEVLSRILYHVTLKKDASEVMAAALARNAKGESTEIAPTEARTIQIERDAQRAAQIAGAPETARSTVGQETPDIMSGAHLASPASVGRVVAQSEQKTQKPFNEAVDMLRSDPSRYMPYFVKKFGVAKVPPDLQQYLPKPKAGADGG